MKIFVTGNRDKFQRFAVNHLGWEMLSLEVVEIQGSSAQEVAEDKARKAWILAGCVPGDYVLVQDDFWELESTPNWPGCSMANTKSWKVGNWLALTGSLPSRSVTKTVAVTLYDGEKMVTEITVYTGWVGLEPYGNSGSVMDKLVCWEGNNTHGLTSSELADAGQYEVVNYPV